MNILNKMSVFKFLEINGARVVGAGVVNRVGGAPELEGTAGNPLGDPELEGTAGTPLNLVSGALVAAWASGLTLSKSPLT